MLRYLIKRLLYMIPIIIGLSILMFILSRLMPGDSVRLALGPDATANQIAALERELGLDKPIVIQYFDYLLGFIRGDLGMSLRTNRNVALDILDTLPATLELVSFAMLIAVIVGVPLGVWASTNYNKFPDFIVRIFSMSGIAIPTFLTAIILQIIFGSWLGILPIIGRGTIQPNNISGFRILDSILSMNFPAFIDSFKHIILPAISLSIASSAQIIRLTRTNMLERINKDYILAARSYGLPDDIVENQYMLKNSFTSVLTLIGMQFGSLIGNAFLVETVFGWPGMARYSIDGLLFKDYNAIISVTLIIGIFFAIINMLIDLLYSSIDPRIKLGGD